MTEELHIETENPSHLFWVPAHLHPEIAPNEFMKWLKTHAKEGFSSDLKDLSKSKLESYELAYDGNISTASETNKLNLLRRSISLNIPNMMGSNFDPSDPNIFDRHSSPDVDSPILVPRMMPALKRAARTKLRRNSVAGEQNPRRFSYHRRTKSTHSPSNKNNSSNNIQQHADLLNVPKISVTDSPSQLSQSIENLIIEDIEPIKNETIIELDCIDVKDGSGPIRITLKDDETKLSSSLPSLSSNKRSNSLPVDALGVSQENRTPETRRPLAEKLKLRVNTLSNKLNSVTSKSSSPTSLSPISPISPLSPLSPILLSESASPSSAATTPILTTSTPAVTTTAATTSTPSSSSTTTSPTTSPSIATVTSTSSTKRSSAWSYLLPWSSNSDESKNKKQKSDKFVEKSDIDNRMLSVVDNNNNVSVRAIYRLSHIKLANPRRPLHEQVLISNMMFWYLSLINKQQMEHGENNNPNVQHAQKETLKAKSKMGKSIGERKRRKADKKAAAEARRRGGGSNAEIAYKAPQYDMLQFSQQFITPPMSPVQYSSSPYTNENEYSDVNNGNGNGNNDAIDENEDVEGRQPPSNQYHHFRDSYVSDGTDGGYLEEAEAGVGNVGGSDIGDNNLLVSRPRSSGTDTLNPYKHNNTDTQIGDEDDDVPLGLFHNNSTPTTK
ncbi:402_t:CDS:2 [Entrophospora sp. SA101]|nr:402_t:CDS:2 [Entrophospora sp. SA101]